MTKILNTELSDYQDAMIANDIRRLNGLKPRSVAVLAKKHIAQRDIMNSRLTAWGEWSTGHSHYASSFAVMADCLGDAVHSDGHDHDLLTDFQSMMIQVDQLVADLKKIESYLIKLEYQVIAKDRVLYWAKKFGRSTSTYKDVKSRVLIKLYKQMSS